MVERQAHIWLLRKQYPLVSGLHNPIFGSNLTFDVMATEGIQIINHMNHWTCLSTIGCKPREVTAFTADCQRLLRNRLVGCWAQQSQC